MPRIKRASPEAIKLAQNRAWQGVEKELEHFQQFLKSTGFVIYDMNGKLMGEAAIERLIKLHVDVRRTIL